MRSTWVTTQQQSSCVAPSPSRSTVGPLPRRRGDAPDLTLVPVFSSLLARPDVSRAQAFVYGAIAAFAALGFDAPTAPQIAYAINACDSGFGVNMRKHIRALERANLLRRVVVRRNVVRYELLGPRLRERGE